MNLMVAAMVEGACAPPYPAPSFMSSLLAGILASEVGFALFDPEDRYVFGSPAFEAFLDVQPGPQTYASMMRHCHRTGRGIAIPNPDIEAWIAAAQAKRRLAPLRTLEKDLADGRWMRITETTFDGGWVLNILDDITDLKSHEMTLRDARDAARVAAETDTLTGLPNRSLVMKRFAEAIHRAREQAEPLVISLIDLDHFKRINDTFGHDAGDRVLVNFANLGRATIREGDTLGRVGGEEFFLVMPGLAAEGIEVVQELRARVARASPLAGVDLSYTMSAGIAVVDPIESIDDAYGRADRLLYRAKTGGRNCIVCA